MIGVQAYVFPVSPCDKEDPMPPFYLISKTSGQSWHGMGMRFHGTRYLQDQKYKPAGGGVLHVAPNGGLCKL